MYKVINKIKNFINLFKYVVENRNTIEKARRFNKLVELLDGNLNTYVLNNINMVQNIYCGEIFYEINTTLTTTDIDFGHKMMKQCQYGGFNV